MTRNEHLILFHAAHEQERTSRDSADALEKESSLCQPEEGHFGCSGCQECGFCRRDAQQDSGQGASSLISHSL